MRRALLPLAAALAGTASAEPGSRQTRDYVAAAGHSDTFELLEAATALAQSQDAQVRAFAERMLTDHHRTAQALAEATARSGLQPPPTIIGADQSPLLGALQGLRGPDFDKAYWRHQVLGHRAALVTARLYAESGDVPAIRAAAQAAVPIISAHLRVAEQNAAATDGS